MNDRDDEEETIEEVAQTKEIDLENLKPGVKLLKMKVAKWKENDHYAILGLQDIRYKEKYHIFTDIFYGYSHFLRTFLRTFFVDNRIFFADKYDIE